MTMSGWVFSVMGTLNSFSPLCLSSFLKKWNSFQMWIVEVPTNIGAYVIFQTFQKKYRKNPGPD